MFKCQEYLFFNAACMRFAAESALYELRPLTLRFDCMLSNKFLCELIMNLCLLPESVIPYLGKGIIL